MVSRMPALRRLGRVLQSERVDSDPLLRPTASGFRHQGGDDLPAMFAIDEEVAVQGKHDALALLLGHSHQTGVGQRHRHRGIARKQRSEPVRLLVDAKGDGKYPPSSRSITDRGPRGRLRTRKQASEITASQVSSGGAVSAKQAPRPGVVLVASIEQGHQRTSVQDDPRPHWP